MTKKRLPRKALPANLPSARWLQELKDTLKQQAEAAIKQSEATLALVKLTAQAAQRITAHAQSAALATTLFTDEELRTGLVDYYRATKLITGLKKPEQAEKTCDELFQWSFMTDPERCGDWFEVRGVSEEEDVGDKMTTWMVTLWLERYQDFVREVPNKGKERAKKYFDSIAGQSALKPTQKRGRKRQVAARGKRNKSKSAE
jgi:hypothetical protein